jgi:hypothetical protein
MDKTYSNSDVALLRNHVSRFLTSKSRLRRPLLQVLGRLAEHRLTAVLFGGTLRDLMLHGPGAEPRDIDVVVDGITVQELAGLFRDSMVRRTRFGGLHLNAKGWAIDIWPLAETWALRELRIGSRDFAALTRTTFLNAEAVAVELAAGKGGRGIQETGFFEAIRSRVLDINLEENPFPELCTVRTLITASKLQYALSRRLAQYVLHHTAKTTLEELESVQLSHYGTVRYNVDTMCQWTRAIQSQVGTAPVVKIPAQRPLQLHLWDRAYRFSGDQSSFETPPANSGAD